MHWTCPWMFPAELLCSCSKAVTNVVASVAGGTLKKKKKIPLLTTLSSRSSDRLVTRRAHFPNSTLAESAKAQNAAINHRNVSRSQFNFFTVVPTSCTSPGPTRLQESVSPKPHWWFVHVSPPHTQPSSLDYIIALCASWKEITVRLDG